MSDAAVHRAAEIMEENGADWEATRGQLFEEARRSRTLRRSLEALGAAYAPRIASQRQRANYSAPPDGADPNAMANERQDARRAASAREHRLYAMILPGGGYLGDASYERLTTVAGHYDAQARGNARKATFFQSLAQRMGDQGADPLSKHVPEEEVESLWEESRG